VRKLLKRIQAALTAAAFAEENEADMARQVLAEADPADATAAPGRKPARPAPRRALPREKLARLP
jgi:hypothetical protein